MVLCMNETKQTSLHLFVGPWLLFSVAGSVYLVASSNSI